MSEPAQPDARHQDRSRLRIRDFVVLTLGSISVLTLLWVSRSIGWIEWLTAAIVLLAGSLAYFVGSQPNAPNPATLEPEAPTQPAPVKPYPSQSISKLVLALPFPTLFVGTDGRLHILNEAARNIFRIESTRETVSTAAIRQPDLLAAIDRVAHTGSAEQVEFSLNEDDESWMAHLQAGASEGEVLVLLEDMSAVQRAEFARADFLANASHELRTPLTALGGYIETMRGPAKNDPEAWDKFLEIMQQQTERMKSLVSDLLSLSRIEFSEHRSPSTRINVSATLEHTSQLLMPIARAADVRLNIKVPDIAVESIADANELSQVIQNLASNAIKYSRQGSEVEIELGTADSMRTASSHAARQMPDAVRAQLLGPRASAEVPALWLRVRDTGAGIKPQHLPRLGERFYRADESRGGKIEGTGLGLAIVKHIMARHRGGLAVESVDGTGSAFGVWMPLAPPNETLTPTT